MKPTTEELVNRFNHHIPKEGEPERYNAGRTLLLDVAVEIGNLTPASREQSVALTKLEEAMFWANASIARS